MNYLPPRFLRSSPTPMKPAVLLPRRWQPPAFSPCLSSIAQPASLSAPSEPRSCSPAGDALLNASPIASSPSRSIPVKGEAPPRLTPPTATIRTATQSSKIVRGKVNNRLLRGQRERQGVRARVLERRRRTSTRSPQNRCLRYREIRASGAWLPCRPARNGWPNVHRFSQAVRPAPFLAALALLRMPREVPHSRIPPQSSGLTKCSPECG